MGAFYTDCVVVNPGNRANAVRVGPLLVDTGSECSWIDAKLLDRVAIQREGKTLDFIMANGQQLRRQIGYGIVRVNEVETIDELVFAEPGDLQLLGARTLEGLNMRVDPLAKKLVAGGPIPAAGGRVP